MQACNSTLGNGVGSSCIFYDVTLGDIDAQLPGAIAAALSTTAICLPAMVGVLSTNNNSYQPAYPTPRRGWDFGSGIGSVNAYNLVMAY